MSALVSLELHHRISQFLYEEARMLDDWQFRDWLAQLDDDGVLVLPVGEEHQFLKRIRRRGNEFIIDTVEAVRFVPLVKGELA